MGRTVDILSLNCRSLTSTNINAFREKLKFFLVHNPSICILCEVNQTTSGMALINHYFRYELRNYNDVLLTFQSHHIVASYS